MGGMLRPKKMFTALTGHDPFLKKHRKTLFTPKLIEKMTGSRPAVTTAPASAISAALGGMATAPGMTPGPSLEQMMGGSVGSAPRVNPYYMNEL